MSLPYQETLNIQRKYDGLLEKVARLRELQKRYFRYREPDILRDCKAAEKEIDEIIKDRLPNAGKTIPEIQPNLFTP